MIAEMNNVDNTIATIEWKKGLPEQHPSLFAKFYGTDRWNKNFFRTTSNELLLTVEAKGERFVCTGRTYDGKWNCDTIRGLDIQHIPYKIIAYAEMPGAYNGS